MKIERERRLLGSNETTNGGRPLHHRNSAIKRKETIDTYRSAIRKNHSLYSELYGLDEIRELTIILDSAYETARLLLGHMDSIETEEMGTSDVALVNNLDRRGQKDMQQLRTAMSSLEEIALEHEPEETHTNINLEHG